MRNVGRQAAWVVALAMLLPLGGRELGAAMQADMVIFNGKILTADNPDPNKFTVAQAAAIYGGKFVAVGSNDEVLQNAGPNTRRIDLEGKTVIPGLIESHLHIYDSGAHWFPPTVPRVARTDPNVMYTTKDEFLAQIRTLAQKKKPGEWVIIMPQIPPGGSIAELQQGAVTRYDLDKIAPNNPVYIHWEVLVNGIANSMALKPLTDRYPNIRGVDKDAKGVPTGRLGGVANPLFWTEFLPHVSPELIGPYYAKEMDEIAAQGITTVSTRLIPNHLTAYSWLHARGELPIRLAYTSEALSRSETTASIATRVTGEQGGSGDTMWGIGNNWLWMIGVTPISLDSLLSAGSACVREKYPRESINFPLWKFQFYGPYGLCRLESTEYPDLEVIQMAGKYGFRIAAMHVGGDRGIDQFLDATEALQKDFPDIKGRRWVIDHCTAVHPDQIERSKRLGVTYSCAAGYLYGGAKSAVGAFAEIYKDEGKAGNGVVPMRGLIDAGLMPVIELDTHGFYPFLAMQVFISRADVTGKKWAPNQAITRQEALYAYTRWSSRYVLREKELGTIEVGKLADFLVLDKDYLTVPEKEIGMIDPLLTVVEGKPVYTEPNFAAKFKLPVVGYQGDRTRWMRGGPNDQVRDQMGGND